MVRGTVIRLPSATRALSAIPLILLLTLASVPARPQPAPASEPDAEFVRSASCKECHKSEYDQWLASDHRNAMRAADENSVRGDFGDRRVRFHEVETRLYRKDGEYRVDTVGVLAMFWTLDRTASFWI